MSDRRGGGFTLVLVHSGGTRMLHVGCPRWLLWVGLTLLLSSGALLTGTWMDYFALKRAHLQAASLERKLEEQRVQLEGFEQRVAEVNREVGGWQDMHVRLWSAFGPAPGQHGERERPEPPRSRPLRGAHPPRPALDAVPVAGPRAAQLPIRPAPVTLD